MKNLRELTALNRTLRDARVLSVYIDGVGTNPATRHAWRKDLDHSLHELRVWLEGSPHAEREEFEACVRRLEDELATLQAGLHVPGWAAFITHDQVHEASPLPVPMPTRAVWSNGICLAPYLRALHEMRPVVVVVVDAAHAALYRYELGALIHMGVVRAHHAVMPPSHMGDAARQGFHGGTRGSTGRDQAQRSLLEGTSRMLDEVARQAKDIAGRDGWIVVGGIPEASEHLIERLDALPERVMHGHSLDVHASDADITQAARVAAAALRERENVHRVHEIADRLAPTGFGVVGGADTRRALEEARVRDLYFTRRYLEEHPVEAEDAVRSALAQDASIEEVSGLAADELDRDGGMAARLRYRIAPQPVGAQ